MPILRRKELPPHQHRQNSLNFTSRFMGRLANTRKPKSLIRLFIRTYIKKYNISLDDYIVPDEGYSTFNEFFTRKLKPKSRPIGQGIISAVDGYIYDSGAVNKDKKIYVKKKFYKVEELIGGNYKFLKSYIVLYLSPANYHRVHASFDMTINSVCYIPGRLKSVKEKKLQKVDNLYCQNERIVIIGNSEYGEFYFIFVGALIIGKVKLNFNSKLETNIKKGKCACQAFDIPIKIKKGEELGYFEMGSTAIILTEDDCFTKVELETNTAVVMGQTILESN